MKDNFNERKVEFENILDLIKTIKTLSTRTKKSINKIKDLYVTLTESNNDPVELFGLDFFNFQYEIYSKQYDNQIVLLNFLNNRIYGDYYKLYKLILNYIKDHVKNDTIKSIIESNSKLPKYNKLDDTVVYPDEILKTLNGYVLNVLEHLYTFYLDKVDTMKSKEKLNNKGFCIGNFVKTVNHKNDMIKNQIELYDGFVGFFNTHHKKVLEQIKEKINLIYLEISNEIHFPVGMYDSDEDEEHIKEKEGDEIKLLIHEMPVLRRDDSRGTPDLEKVLKALGPQALVGLNDKNAPVISSTIPEEEVVKEEVVIPSVSEEVKETKKKTEPVKNTDPKNEIVRIVGGNKGGIKKK